MGTDIRGWVEVKESYGLPHHAWHGTIVIPSLIPGAYDSFGCLFGVRNYAGFAPVAAGRGLPDDLSVEVKQEITGLPYEEAFFLSQAEVITGFATSGDHNPSWLPLAAIRAIDPDEPAQAVDERVSKYRREADGTLTLVGTAAWSADFARASGVDLQRILRADLGQGERPVWKEGQT